MRAILRVSVVGFIALGALLCNAGDIVDPWYPWNTYGFTTDSAATVTTVDDYARAHGLRVGDVVNLAAMPLGDRVQLGPSPSAYKGRTISVPLRSGRTVRLVSHTRERSLAENVTDVFSVTSLVLYTLLAAALVLLRPMPATWTFCLFSAGFLYNGNQAYQFFPAWLLVVLSFVMFPLLQAGGPIAFYSFALRFPNAQPQGSRRRFERVMWFVAAPILIAFNLASFLAPACALQFPALLTAWTQIVIAAMYVPGIVQFVYRYTRAARDDRARLQWAVAGLAIAFLPYVFFTAAENALANVISLAVANVTQAWLLIAPVALAYTILKHRLFDIRFVMSRALVYGILTTLTVGILALADWALGRWLAQSRFQLVAELAVALVIGFSLTTLHSRIQRFLNGVIFRAQTLALSAVRRFTHEIDLINDPAQLLAQTSETLRRRIESDYVAIYTAEGNTFVLSGPQTIALPALLSANDLAVLRLRRWHEPFECDVPEHALRGALLLPMAVRTQLVGFIACGPKPDHTHYLPDEVTALESLTHRCGGAYAWLTMRPATEVLSTSYPQP